MSRAYDNAADARFQQGGRRNLIINGNFDVWQRGTSFTTDNVYTADRWKSADGSGGSPARTLSRQAFTVGQTDVPGEPTYYARHNQTGASTNSNSNLAQRIEGVRTGADQSVTLSFWAKASASLDIRLRFLQDFGSSGSSTVDTAIADAFTIGTSWAKYTYTQTLPSISGKTISGGDDYFEIQLEFTNSSTFTFDIAQVQLELGNVATPFEHRSYGEELALCQRYYYISDMGATDSIDGVVSIRRNSTVACHHKIYFAQTMRASPSADTSNMTATGSVGPGAGANSAYGNAPYVQGITTTLAPVGISGVTATTTAEPFVVRYDGFFAFDAEL